MTREPCVPISHGYRDKLTQARTNRVLLLFIVLEKLSSSRAQYFLIQKVNLEPKKTDLSQCLKLHTINWDINKYSHISILLKRD